MGGVIFTALFLKIKRDQIKSLHTAKTSCHNLNAVNLFNNLNLLSGDVIMKHFLCCIAFILAVFSFSLPVFAANPAETAVSETQAVHKTAAVEKTVNINTADARTIVDAHIKGIGKKRAEEIVAYRTQHGPFKSVDDLKNVKGISEKIIDANRSHLALE